MEMFAGGTLRPRNWETLLVSTVRTSLDAMGPGLLCEDEEVWKEVWELSATHRPPTELQEHKALCTARRVEVVLRNSSCFWLAWVQLVARRSGPNLGGTDEVS